MVGCFHSHHPECCFCLDFGWWICNNFCCFRFRVQEPLRWCRVMVEANEVSQSRFREEQVFPQANCLTTFPLLFNANQHSTFPSLIGFPSDTPPSIRAPSWKSRVVGRFFLFPPWGRFHFDSHSSWFWVQGGFWRRSCASFTFFDGGYGIVMLLGCRRTLPWWWICGPCAWGCGSWNGCDGFIRTSGISCFHPPTNAQSSDWGFSIYLLAGVWFSSI